MQKLSRFPGVKPKGIYLLPNLLTTAALFSGFYAIVTAMHGAYEYSAIAIFVAMVFDGLDGRVARLIGAQSAFGVQYDSMSDLVCFGLAPALVVYSWGLSSLGKVGWLASFMFTAATCLRLARFNILQNEPADNKYFLGLPCPPAAALLASMVWLSADLMVPGKYLSTIVAVITVALSLLMMSNVRYYSFKDLDLKSSVPFVAIFMVVISFVLIAWDPPKVLFTAGLLYALSGLVMLVFDKNKTTKLKLSKKKHDT